MKNLIKKIVVANMLLASAYAGFAQTDIDLQVAATSSNAGVFPGFVYAGTLNVTFNHNGFTNMPANSFRIQLGLPVGVEFDNVYPGIPAGWVYARLGPQDARLTPSAQVVLLSGVVFNVPFKTTQTVPATTFTGAQLVNLQPSFYTDPVSSNNQSATTISVLNTPLPVQFHSFDVKAEGCDMKLDWVTSNEVRNAYFTIDRSMDGITFETIAKVVTNTGGSDKGVYQYTDKQPASGTNFYRVSQHDFDGKSYTTTVVSARPNCNVMARIELFPNPATEVVKVKGLSGQNIIRLFNVLGQQQLEESTDTDNYPVPVRTLPSGTYHIQVVKSGKIIFNGKFVKAD